MHLLDTITIMLAGLMVGSELAVSAFFNPAAWRLESTAQAQALSILAGSLGRVMPVWYGLCLVLLGLEVFLHWHHPVLIPLLAATLMWVGAIGLSISALVPINNRIASLNMKALAPGWKQEHKKWDSLHRVRIVLLALALLALTYALTV
jgi:uncharacterized membrane protein